VTASVIGPAWSVFACAALGYVSGSLPWALWLGRWRRGVDVRAVGSGNLGATNVYRTLGPSVGIPVLLLDIAKGALPVLAVPASPLAAAFPGGAEWCGLAVGMSAIFGHMFTFLAGFKGGKGVATTVGVLLAVAPWAFAAFVAVFFATLAATRYVSLGSILGSVAFASVLPIVTPGGVRSPTFVFGALVAILIVARHRANIVRLLRGTENRMSFRPRDGRPAGAP
jgi:acyl phosphate:glycerol-3-phosphate acyltransferase